jgi:hypothetical protein
MYGFSNSSTIPKFGNTTQTTTTTNFGQSSSTGFGQSSSTGFGQNSSFKPISTLGQNQTTSLCQNQTTSLGQSTPSHTSQFGQSTPSHTSQFGQSTPSHTSQFGQSTPSHTSQFGQSTPSTLNSSLGQSQFGQNQSLSKIECQISLNMDKNITKDSVLDQIIIKPKLSKIEKDQVSLTSRFTKDRVIKSCTVVVSDNTKDIIDNILIGGISIVKDINLIKKVQNHIKFINTDIITINHNALLSQLYKIYLESKPELIYVMNDTNYIGVVTKNDIEISMMLKCDDSLFVYQLVTQFPVYFTETQYDWIKLMETPSEELLINFRTTNTIPIVNENSVIGEVSLNKLSEYYNKKNTVLFNENGKLFVGIQVTPEISGIQIDNLINLGVNLLYIESDNVYNEKIYNLVKEIKLKYPKVIIMIGKVLTSEVYKYFSDSGADCISVGDSTEVGHLSRLQECKVEYLNTKIPIISNSGKIKDANIFKVLVAGANCVMLENINDTTIETIKNGLCSINVKDLDTLHNENIEIYKY